MIKMLHSRDGMPFKTGIFKLYSLLFYIFLLSVVVSAEPVSVPNILLIMSDDSGYADLGCYGGEIDTPNLDRLGREGMRFRHFYNNARCSPTRATLMTGMASARVGFGAGTLGGWHKERKPSAYRARLPYDIPTIPELLKGAGYRTLMVGKWHIGGSLMKTGIHSREEWKQKHPGWELTQEEIDADFNALPPQRGFEEYFGFLEPDADCFIVPDADYKGWRPVTESKHRYLHGNEPARIKAEKQYNMRCFIDRQYDRKEEGHPLDGKSGLAWYSQDGMTDQAVDMIKRSKKDGKPFFLYLAYQAPHTPLQVPAELVNKYAERYRGMTFAEVEQARFDGLVREGILDPSVEFERTFSEKSRPRDDMESNIKDAVIYHAAMMENTDTNIGRVIKTLEDIGELDNTLIFYLSDNGARAEVGHLLNKPYKGAKALLWEGGQKTACIAFWKIKIQPGQLTDAVGWVGDFLPTCLDVAGISYPKEFRGRKLSGTDGRSILPALLGEEMPPPVHIFTTDKGQTAVIRGGQWKLLINPGWTGHPAVNRPDPTRYELYDLSVDPAEKVNVASKHPQMVAELEAACMGLRDEQGMIDYYELEKIDPDRTRF